MTDFRAKILCNKSETAAMHTDMFLHSGILARTHKACLCEGSADTERGAHSAEPAVRSFWETTQPSLCVLCASAISGLQLYARKKVPHLRLLD